MKEEILQAAQILWDYHLMNHPLEKSDCILVLGSHDLRVANWAASLYLEGWAPLILMSGGLGNFTRNLWTEPEADQFARIALSMGVPGENVLIENKSTNTGENIIFSSKLLAEKGYNPKRFIVVQKPYMERRSYATFKKHWPDKKLIISSPPGSMRNYPNAEIPMDIVIHIMVGDLQRIKEYPQKGFQIYQEIPDRVWKAYEWLISEGFTDHLIKEDTGK